MSVLKDELEACRALFRKLEAKDALGEAWGPLELDELWQYARALLAALEPLDQASRGVSELQAARHAAARCLRRGRLPDSPPWVT